MIPLFLPLNFLVSFFLHPRVDAQYFYFLSVIDITDSLVNARSLVFLSFFFFFYLVHIDRAGQVAFLVIVDLTKTFLGGGVEKKPQGCSGPSQVSSLLFNPSVLSLPHFPVKRLLGYATYL